MSVLRVDGADGKLRGLLVHFAAHPTILGSANRKISAEWPGAACDEIERAHPGATALVLQGAVGDVSPAGGEGQDFERVASYGRLVAARALALSAQGESDATPELSGVAVRVPLPPMVGGRLLGRAPSNELVPASPAVRRRVPACSGSARSVSTRSPASRRRRSRGSSRSEAPSGPSQPRAPADGRGLATVQIERLDLLVSCANDHLGYLTDRAAFRRGGYEPSLNLSVRARTIPLRRRAECSATPPPTTRLPTRPRIAVVRPADVRQWRASSASTNSSSRSPASRATISASCTVASLKDRIRALLASAQAELVAEAVKSGLLPKLLPLAIGTGIPPKDLVIPALVLAARSLQKNIPTEYLDEMEGVAEGAGVPYDSILLENTFLTLAEQTDPSKLLELPARCTNMAFFGDATTLGQPLLVSTLDWGMEKVLKDATIVLEMKPSSGHPFVSVTWPGMVGTLRAMGAQGLAVTEESVAAPNDTSADGVPINFLLRDVIEHANGLDDAVARVVKAQGTAGYHVTILDGHRRDARVVEKTATRQHVRKPVDGVLWGCDPTEQASFDGVCDASIPRADGSSVVRYASSRDVFGRMKGHIDARTAMLALPSPKNVWKEGTLLACVFEPQIGRYHVCLRDGLDLDPIAGTAQWTTGTMFDRRRDDAMFARYYGAPAVPDTGTVTEGDRHVAGKIVRIPVDFDSPRPSGIPKNDRIHATLYLPADAEPKGAIIQLPVWKERSLAGEALISMTLATKGYAVFLFPLPYQVDRAPDGVGPGDWTISSDLSRTREAWAQGMADVLRASRWLEAKGFDAGRQAIMGISLGGHMAADCFGAYPARFAGGLFLLTGGDLDLLLASKQFPDKSFAERVLAKGVTADDVRDLIGPLDPLSWIGPPTGIVSSRSGQRASDRGDDVLLVGARADELVPPAHVEALAKALPGSHLVWVPGGHYDGVKSSGPIFDAIYAHLDRIFRPR